MGKLVSSKCVYMEYALDLYILAQLKYFLNSSALKNGFSFWNLPFIKI